MDCEIKISLQFQFESGSWVLSDDERQKLREASPHLRRMLEPPERKITVVGHVLPSEARTQESLRQIATRRADVVRRALLQEGLPKERLTAKAAPVEDGTSTPPIYRVVTFDIEPTRPFVSDFPRDAGAR
jgi:outer membrane protein OmpA-like peptidoglycan-associated protein